LDAVEVLMCGDPLRERQSIREISETHKRQRPSLPNQASPPTTKLEALGEEQVWARMMAGANDATEEQARKQREEEEQVWNAMMFGARDVSSGGEPTSAVALPGRNNDQHDGTPAKATEITRHGNVKGQVSKHLPGHKHPLLRRPNTASSFYRSRPMPLGPTKGDSRQVSLSASLAPADIYPEMKSPELKACYLSVGIQRTNRSPENMTIHAIRHELQRRSIDTVGNKQTLEPRLQAARNAERHGGKSAEGVGAVGVYEGEQVYIRPYEGRITESDLYPYPNHNAFALANKDDQNIKDLCTPLSTDPVVMPRRPCVCMACRLKEMRALRFGDVEDGIPNGKNVHRNPGDGNLYLEIKPDRLIVNNHVAEARLTKFRLERYEQLRNWAAERIQCQWRCYRVRRKFMADLKLNLAAVVVGRFMLGHLGRRSYRRAKLIKNIAAITIQLAARGHAARLYYQHLRVKKEGAAAKLERVYRGRRGRKRWTTMHRKMSRAATTFQAIARGHNGRWEARKKRELFTRATLRIQAMVRGALRVTQGRIWFRDWHAIRTSAAVKIQRQMRVRLLRTWVPRLRQKRRCTSTEIQKIARGWLVRMGIYKTERASAAVKIETVWRTFSARRRVQKIGELKMIVRIQMAIRAKLARIRLKEKKLKKIYVMLQILKIQIFWRKQVAKARAAEKSALAAEKSALAIQRGYRAYIAMRNYRLTKKKLMALERMSGRERVLKQVESEMMEVDKVIACRDDWWPGDEDPYLVDHNNEHPIDVQRRCVEVFLQHRTAIRRCFIHFSNLLVSDPKKAFQMNRQQFHQFTKAIEFEGDADHIFQICNTMTSMGVLHRGRYRMTKPMDTIGDNRDLVLGAFKSAATHGLKVTDSEQLWTAEATEKQRRTSKEEPTILEPKGNRPTIKIDMDTKVMVSNEFVHALTLMADKTHPDVKLVDQRLEKFLHHRLRPIANGVDLGMPSVVTSHKDTPAVQAVFDTFTNRLQRFYRHYTTHRPDVTRSYKKDHDCIDCYEWMMACHDCGVIRGGISFSKLLDIFVRCNQQELDSYCQDSVADPDSIKGMALTYDEFCNAVLTTAAMGLQGQDLDTRLGPQLETLVTNMLSDGPRKF